MNWRQVRATRGEVVEARKEQKKQQFRRSWTQEQLHLASEKLICVHVCVCVCHSLALVSLYRYLQFVDSQEMVCIHDNSGTVVSLPPLTNSENTKVCLCLLGRTLVYIVLFVSVD